MGFLRLIKIVFFCVCLTIFSLLNSNSVLAQCLPGLPCIEAAYEGDDPTANPKYNKAGADEACDADFMNQIYARSFIEAEREVAIAAQDVVKPDSVLELSCFDYQAKTSLETHNPYFSGDTSLAGAIDNLGFFDGTLEPAISDYISDNYGHSFLVYSSEDYSAGASTCDYIMAVQTLARCGQVDSAGPNFYDFETLVGADPRVVATSGAACTSALLTQDVVDVADNKDLTYVKLDVFEEYSDIVSGDACGDPVSTGASYAYSDDDLSWTDIGALIFGTDEVREHKVCVNPLCEYDYEANSCEM